MPKLKIRKAVSKRFKISGTKKVIRQKGGQNHFNARESGNTTRSKRNDVQVRGKIAKNILTDIVQR